MAQIEISHDLAQLDFERTSELIKSSYWGGARTDELNRRAFAKFDLCHRAA